MEQYYVVFSSITHTMKVEKRVKLPGKRCTIVHTPAEFGLGSCGYSIRTDSEEYARYIFDVAKTLDVRMNGIYRVGEQGDFEVIT